MRGIENKTEALFVYLSPESYVSKDHPLRPIRVMVDKALAELDAEFEAIYSDTGRPSIPPEQLLKALLLQAFYTITHKCQDIADPSLILKVSGHRWPKCIDG